MKFANVDRGRSVRVEPAFEVLESRLLLAFDVGPSSVIDANTYSVADVDGDGKPDLAGVVDGKIGFRLNLGDAAFAPLISVDSGLANLASVTFADVTGDGKPDAIAVDTKDGKLAILAGHGDGTFGSPTVYDDPGIDSVFPADVNGDGKLDLVADAASLSVVSPIRTDLFLNQGDGTFDLHSGILTFAAATYADFDGDGNVDLAGLVFDDNGTRVAYDLAVARGHGDGTFAAPTITQEPFSIFGNQSLVARQVVGSGLTTVPVDFNGDGKPDLLESDFENGVNVLLNDGSGGFLAPIHDDSAVGPIQVLIGDFDGDGKPDLLLDAQPSDSGYDLDLQSGDGSGHFGQPTIVGIGDSGFGVADFDNDGKPDLLTVSAATEDAGTSIALSAFRTSPVLAPIGDRTGSLDTAGSVGYQASAYDLDSRATIRYASNVGTIDPLTGDFYYQPAAPGTVVVTITATATLASTTLSASQSFQVVTPAPAPPSVVLSQSTFFPIDAGATWTTDGLYFAGLKGLATATADYGDGTGATPLSLSPPLSFTLAHTYASPGTYTVRVVLTDAFGGEGTATATETVLAGGGGGSWAPIGSPAPVQVASITLTVTKGAIAAFNVAFTGLVSNAANPAAYHLLLVTTKRVKKKLVTITKILGIKSVGLDPSGTVARVVPAGRLLPGKVSELTITAADLLDAQGRPLDGNHDGQAGGDLIADIHGKALTIR